MRIHYQKAANFPQELFGYLGNDYFNDKAFSM